jgi:hypothetical protein
LRSVAVPATIAGVACATVAAFAIMAQRGERAKPGATGPTGPNDAGTTRTATAQIASVPSARADSVPWSPSPAIELMAAASPSPVAVRSPEPEAEVRIPSHAGHRKPDARPPGAPAAAAQEPSAVHVRQSMGARLTPSSSSNPPSAPSTAPDDYLDRMH